MKFVYRPDAVARGLFFALVPAVAVGGGMALPVLLALAGAFALRPSLLRQVVENKPLPLGLFVAFVAWAVLSTAWSSYGVPTQAIKLTVLVPLGLTFAAAAAADPGARRLTLAAGLAAFLVLALCLGIEAAGNLPLNRIAQPDVPIGELGRNVSRGVTILLAIVWAGAASLLAAGGRLRLAGALGVLVIGGALSTQFEQFSNLLGFAVGLTAFAAAFWQPDWTLRLVSLGLAGWVLIAPFATPLLLANQRLVDSMPLSWAARVGIWRYVCARIVEAPLFGHGLDASRAVTDRIQVRELDMRAIQLHPHSASLQIWFETGAVGAAFAAGALILGGWAMSRLFATNRPAAAAAAATLACLGLIGNVSFGLWQEWWGATLFMAAALVAALATPRAEFG